MNFSKQISVLKTAILCILLLALGACSSITKGTSQDVLVDTQKVKEAKCTLKNEKGSWIVYSTPGTANVARGGGDLSVTCEKKEYEKATQLISQGFEPMTLGNILIGGVVGVVVDAASGAAFDYPPSVSVALKPLDPSSPTNGSSKNNEKLYMSNLQGNWTAHRGEGCFEVNSSPVDITVNAFIENDLLKLSVTHTNVFGDDPGQSLKGLDNFKEDRELIFDPGYDNVEIIKINVDENSENLQVLFDNKCKVTLQKTDQQVISWNFKGKRAIRKAIAATNENADFSSLEGNWTGFKGAGCISFYTYPADVTAYATVKDNIFRMKLTHEHTFGTDQGAGLKAEDRIPVSGKLVFDPNYSEVNEVVVQVDKVNDLIKVSFQDRCTVVLNRTTDQTLPPDFKGKKAIRPVADFNT